jgi:GNAT superfamily N-acetyltransferase
MDGFGDLVFRPLTMSNWSDFESFFEQDTACNMCWCMYWRKPRSQLFGHHLENREDMRQLVASGNIPGFLAYRAGKVIAWCSVAPRKEYSGLDRSPTLKPVDDKEVWSITCFVVAKGHRRKGMTAALIEEAMRFAKERGAKSIEAYPLINREKKFRFPGETFMGFASTFEEMGFEFVSNRSEVRNIMRLEL